MRLYIRLLIILVLILLSSCSPFGNDRYFQYSFSPLYDEGADIELLLLSGYSGEKPPSKEVVNIITIIKTEYLSSKNMSDQISYELIGTSIKGELVIGEPTPVNRESLSLYKLGKIVENQETLILVLEYSDGHYEEIEMIGRGGPSNFY